MRHGVDLDAQAAGRLVDQVDRLVGQEAVGDVALGELSGSDQRRVHDAHAVVHLVALAQTAQDRDRVGHGRLAHEHRRETPLERRVLLDVLAVLVERRRADRAQLAAREHRLEQVGRVDGALGRTGADDRVQLVDEQDDAAVGRGDLLEHGLEALLELAAVLRAGQQGAEVECPDAAPLEALGDVARDDALGQALDDRRLADAGLADQHRVVLGAPRQHLHRAPDLVVAPDHGIELAALGDRGEVAAEARERVVALLGVLVVGALRAAQLLRRLEQRGPPCAAATEPVGEREQQVLDGDELVAELARLLASAIERLAERERWLLRRRRAARRRQLGDRLLGVRAHGVAIGAGAAQQHGRRGVRLGGQREQQVVGGDLRVAVATRKLGRGRKRLPRPDRELIVRCHVRVLGEEGNQCRGASACDGGCHTTTSCRTLRSRSSTARE